MLDEEEVEIQQPQVSEDEYERKLVLTYRSRQKFLKFVGFQKNYKNRRKTLYLLKENTFFSKIFIV